MGKHAIYRCTASGCDYETTSRAAFLAHQVLHNGRKRYEK